MNLQLINLEKIYELCDRGYFPIVKKGYEYCIFTPFKKEDYYRRSSWEKDQKNCEEMIGASYQDPDDMEPTHLSGFYQLPSVPFEVGDKVKVRENLKDLRLDRHWETTEKEYQETNGKLGVITFINEVSYDVQFDDINDWYPYAHYQLEPFISPAEKLQIIKIGSDTYEMTPEFLEALKGLKKL